MTNPLAGTPPASPLSPPSSPSRAPVATLSRDLADFLLELSITLNKHAIYPTKHPLLDVAIDGVATRLAMLLVDDRDALSIGVARRQLIIEGVATDPTNPVLKELAERLHKHHIGAVKFVRGIGRDELADALAALALDPVRTDKPIGFDTERLGEIWQHVRYFPLTYDKLQLIEDDGSGEKPSADQLASSRATLLWIGLARAALVSDASQAGKTTEQDENTALEPATVARAIDEHQREEAYDQVIVGYLLQIGDELRNAEGPEAAALQRRVSHLVGSLKDSTLEKLLEMGGDRKQRRKFLLDASQGVTVEAVIDLVKAASAAEGQTVSHSMLRMLTKLGNHPSGSSTRGRTDPSIRDVMRRLVDDWTLDDPNPEAYRAVLQEMSTSKSGSSDPKLQDSVATECEPERMVQIAVEIGAFGPQVTSAMIDLCQTGQAELLLDLVERAPSAEAGAPVWNFLVEQRIYESILSVQRVDIPLAARFAQRIGPSAIPLLLRAAISHDDAKLRAQFYEAIQPMGDDAGPAIVEVLAEAMPMVQRELLALIGKLGVLPREFSPKDFLPSPEPLLRREALRLMLREPNDRDNAVMHALADPDDRVVFIGLTAAQEKCPPEAAAVIRQRVDAGDLDAQLRTMGIKLAAQAQTPENLAWLLDFVLGEARWPRRPKLKPSTPEMLAALGILATVWRADANAASAIALAEQSKDDAVRAKVDRARTATQGPRS